MIMEHTKGKYKTLPKCVYNSKQRKIYAGETIITVFV